MNIWFIILVTVLTSGEVYTEIKIPKDLKYNNEKMCMEAGQMFTDLKQVEIGKNGKVAFTCNVLTETDIRDALTEKTDL